jgi:hypothetical protein
MTEEDQEAGEYDGTANRRYRKRIGNQRFNFIEISEYSNEDPSLSLSTKSEASLQKLLGELERGVRLVVFVTRERITEASQWSFELLRDACGSGVRIVAAITGLEKRKTWMDGGPKIRRLLIRTGSHSTVSFALLERRAS